MYAYSGLPDNRLNSPFFFSFIKIAASALMLLTESAFLEYAHIFSEGTYNSGVSIQTGLKPSIRMSWLRTLLQSFCMWEYIVMLASLKKSSQEYFTLFVCCTCISSSPEAYFKTLKKRNTAAKRVFSAFLFFPKREESEFSGWRCSQCKLHGN